MDELRQLAMYAEKQDDIDTYFIVDTRGVTIKMLRDGKTVAKLYGFDQWSWTNRRDKLATIDRMCEEIRA